MSIPLISFFFILLGFAKSEPAPIPFGDLVGSALRTFAGETAPAATDSLGVRDGAADLAAAREFRGDGAASSEPRADLPASGELHGNVAAFYELHGLSPVWISEAGLTPAGEELLALFRSSRLQGLEPREYLTAALESRITGYYRIAESNRVDRALTAARLDVALTSSFLRFAQHKSSGRIDPHLLEPDWPVAPQADRFVEGLVERLVADGPVRAVEAFEARHPMYRGLAGVLREYRGIEAAGGWVQVPAGPDMAVGNKGARVSLLRQRLGVQTAGMDSASFDGALKSAVEEFQKHHGLNATGKVDKATLAALNVPVEERIRQIELSLERARWLPADFGSRYIVVNIPEAMLRVVESDSVVFSSRAVVGKAERQTPVLLDTMTSLVLNPYWNLPPVVIDEDVLPKLTKNTDYLKQKNVKVYRGWGKGQREIHPDSVRWSRWTSKTMPYHLRMDPGPANALGRVKFLFPNGEHIYIHDSPQRSLYRREQRQFSSGCVRVERARDLAAYLLNGSPRWDKERLAEAFASGEEQSVSLRNPIPVYIVYLTAWVDADGVPHFRPDLYGRDELLAVMLGAPSQPS